MASMSWPAVSKPPRITKINPEAIVEALLVAALPRHKGFELFNRGVKITGCACQSRTITMYLLTFFYPFGSPGRRFEWFAPIGGFFGYLAVLKFKNKNCFIW